MTRADGPRAQTETAHAQNVSAARPWPRALVFGAQGQMGRELVARAPAAGVTVTAFGRADVDLADGRALAAALRNAAFDAVINAAAFNAVDLAETEHERANAVNAEAPRLMARACAERGARLVHVSTDYVFDGAADAPYGEDAAPAPLNAYGRSKLAGEAAVLDAHPGAVVIRTAWVYSRHPGNFASRLVAQTEARGADAPSLKGVKDQWSSPTFAGDLADAALALVSDASPASSFTGLLHVAGEGVASRLEFMEAILASAGLELPITPVSASEFPAPATRPRYTPLLSARARALGLPIRPWRHGVAAAFAVD